MAATAFPYTEQSPVSAVTEDPVLGRAARLVVPLNRGYFHGKTLGELSLTWYSHIDPRMTVTVINDLHSRAERGEPVFFEIYSGEEQARDPSLKDTGLFFFKGRKDAPFALCLAGGGFAYVGSIHYSFPHAYTLAGHGYNAFALIYRPDAREALQDTARALSFIREHAYALEINPDHYSLWGGSAGARLAAWLGDLGTERLGERYSTPPAAVIMQYTGHREYTRHTPPTFACVGDSDWIAPDYVMEERIAALKDLGIDAEVHVYKGLGHGFGLGTGTVAEGWIDRAIAFWERQLPPSLRQSAPEDRQ